LITTYNANEELIRLSAYVKGSDSKVDMAISKKDAIDEFLKQRIEVKSDFQDAKKRLAEIFSSSQDDEY
jgi:flagellum-specific ATP synthase